MQSPINSQPTTSLASLGWTLGGEKEDWLKRRRSGIGGSEAAAVLGVSPFKSAFTLWAEKTEKVPEPDLDMKEYIYWGNKLEPVIADRYSEETGRSLIDYGRYAIKYHPEISFMHCTIDRALPLPGPEDVKRIGYPEFADGYGSLSIKNANEFTLQEWEEDTPLHYQVQLQQELCVTGWLWGGFAVLIGGNTFRWADARKNEAFISMLKQEEERFWTEFVQKDIPPPVDKDASDSTLETLKRLYPKHSDKVINLPEYLKEVRNKRRELKDQIRQAEKDIQGYEIQLRAAMGAAVVGGFQDGTGLVFKMQERKGYYVEPTSFRVLREVKNIKKVRL